MPTRLYSCLAGDETPSLPSNVTKTLRNRPQPNETQLAQTQHGGARTTQKQVHRRRTCFFLHGEMSLSTTQQPSRTLKKPFFSSRRNVIVHKGSTASTENLFFSSRKMWNIGEAATLSVEEHFVIGTNIVANCFND